MRPTASPPPHRRSLRAAIVISAALATSLAGAGQAALAMDPTTTDLEAAAGDARLARAEAQLNELQARLDETSETNAALNAEVVALADQVAELVAENESLEAERAALRQEAQGLALERDRLRGSVEHFTGLFDALEADRQLLVALRKDLPADSRAEAEAHIERIRRLAVTSNPSGLGQLVDRVGEAAPAYLEWRFTEHPTAEAATQAYIASSANAFDSTMAALRSAILLSVANRLDGLLNVLDRFR
jgi:multidrug efflux pump subunit AcrA (membrane-fusion protein)